MNRSTSLARLATLQAKVIIFCLVTAAGSAGFAIGGHPPLKAATSFAAGMVMAYGAFAFGTFNIRMADRVMPSLTLLAAVLSYGLTVILLALILAATDSRSVHTAAIATGLMSGVALWIAMALTSAVVSTEAASADV